jgi:hypothetical protein
VKLVIFAAAIALSVPALAQDTTQPAPASGTASAATDSTASDPPGGYAPPPAPPVPPGATVVFKEAPPPDVAFPPPPPLASYPVCKRGQFDKCIQRNDPK